VGKGLEEVKAVDGSVFWVLPVGVGPREAAEAVLRMVPTPEVERRVNRNRWSYEILVPLTRCAGGRLAVTPNGMLLALGLRGPAKLLAQRGGTTYGDVFCIKAERGDDAAHTLRQLIQTRPLERLLRHEEIHSQQWARGAWRFAVGYLIEAVWARLRHRPHRDEVEAGLRDGGYQ
jgi:hypothetical protein